jgi:hypothetical protein
MNTIDLSQFKSERELFIEFRNALALQNREYAKEIAKEYGKREYTTMNGESLEFVFKRNPVLKEWMEKGKATGE